MPEFMTHNPYGRHSRPGVAKQLRLDCVAPNLHPAELHAVDCARMRPDIVRRARGFTTGALVNDRQPVENPVAIVVEIPEIDFIGNEMQGIGNKCQRPVGAIIVLFVW